ncbi:DegV family protein with EDD domain [Mumia flava]|uniref:DegV family protein with EDD domain n=1 Tax=Mumia flava TaxID=1348852 RepID=A0A0B2BAX7_9ACTN|nr:DegV family protein [Mumia flava]PJJ53919.1 DegV family protein with EDD domain [Mumia flava]
MTFAIVTDSTASLPADLVRRYDLTVVPLEVVVGDRVFVEGEDITADEVAQALRSGATVSTSRPSPEALARCYETLAAQGAEAIVSVHLSSAVSATFESAQIAAQDAPVPVLCVDTLEVGMASGYAAVAAARAREAGASAEDAAKAATECAERATTLFYVATLEHLRRGGRIGAASALVGSALAVKPLLSVREGQVRPVEKVRTASRAIARLEELALQAATLQADGVAVAVQHLDAPEAAQALADRLAEQLGLDSVPVVEVSAVVGAHVGPGLLAVTVAPVSR